MATNFEFGFEAVRILYVDHRAAPNQSQTSLHPFFEKCGLLCVFENKIQKFQPRICTEFPYPEHSDELTYNEKRFRFLVRAFLILLM
jgi:hypothetical protein